MLGLKLIHVSKRDPGIDDFQFNILVMYSSSL